jgi:hypothetical protein
LPASPVSFNQAGNIHILAGTAFRLQRGVPFEGFNEQPESQIELAGVAQNSP